MTHAAPATILIVEDEALVREVTAIEFEEAGFCVLSAGDGQEAFALLQGHAGIDLLFTDISLPGGIDGWTIASHARALRPDLPVIYATGYSPDPVKLVPGGRFFKKPYLPATIIAAARELLGSSNDPGLAAAR
jgi:CheY-like chemotaxis protein